MAALAGVIGQYYFSFELDGAGDFLGASGKIHTYYMEEKIGGEVPIFKLVFSTTDASVIKTINEGSIIKCEFGKSFEETTYSEMVIQSFKYEEFGNEYLLVTLSGMLRDTAKYLSDTGQKAYPKKVSKDVMIEEAEPYFTIYDETDPELKLEDEQTWVKMGITTTKFISDTWKYSYVSEDNFLIYGIDFFGNFILTDLKYLLTDEVRYTLTHEESTNPNWAAYTPVVNPSSDFGLMNHLALYKKKGQYHNGNDEVQEIIETPELKSFLVDSINIMKEGPVKHENPTIFDADNSHKNINLSRYSNVSRTNLQDSVELNILIEHKWVNYELLRLIEFVPYRPGMPSLFEAETETLGGVYVITRISRFFANNRAGIELTISRDGITGGEGGGLLDSIVSPFSGLIDLF